jgi:hypothetical protein
MNRPLAGIAASSIKKSKQKLPGHPAVSFGPQHARFTLHVSDRTFAPRSRPAKISLKIVFRNVSILAVREPAAAESPRAI